MSRTAYFAVAAVLLAIGLAFAIAMQIGIAKYEAQTEATIKAEREAAPQEVEPTPAVPQVELKPTITGTAECDRAYVKGYTTGYKNGIKAYCDTGTDTKEILPNLMCYDNGYDRGFMQGVDFAHQNPKECLKDKPIKEVELDIEAK